ncbi:hypothetical protein I4U23_027697 [Adineta vaga]|nr:hypothetical protein I4U23_027697 [Adineta vaga]
MPSSDPATAFKGDDVDHDQQIKTYHNDRLEEYSLLSKQDFFTLAERNKAVIHHTINKCLKEIMKIKIIY